MSAIATQAGSGYPYVKFAAQGDSVAGRIVEFNDYQVTEFADDAKRDVKRGDPKFFPSGDPIMATKVILETNPGDETSRVTLAVEKPNMLKAVAKAFRDAGRADLVVGDDLAVTRSGMDGRAQTFSAAYAVAE